MNPVTSIGQHGRCGGNVSPICIYADPSSEIQLLPNADVVWKHQLPSNPFGRFEIGRWSRVSY